LATVLATLEHRDVGPATRLTTIWIGVLDRILLRRTLVLRLRRDQIHAAASALVECGTNPTRIRSLSDLVTPANFKGILRRGGLRGWTDKKTRFDPAIESSGCSCCSCCQRKRAWISSNS
jgi:hypothetical protein